MSTRNFNQFALLATCAVALLALTSSPQALAQQSGVISVQFEAQDGGNPNVANIVTGTAGLIPVGNWNTADVTGGTGTLSNLVNSNTPSTATTASVSWSCPNTWSNISTNNGGNDSLFDGYLDDNESSATITNIPYPVYDIYIYTHGDNGAGNPQGPYWVDIPSASHSFGDSSTNGTGLGNFQICQNDYSYTPNLSTGVGTRIAGGGGTGSPGNTIVFSNLTASSIKISSDPNGRNGGYRSPTNGFQIVDRTATITSIVPNVGVTAGGNVVTLIGTNFVTGATITFDGVAATSVTFTDAQHYQATVPGPHATGTVNVVYTQGANLVTVTNGYTYSNQQPPTITSVTLTPTGTAVGPTGGGTNITITGTNFEAGDLVNLGGTNGFTSTAATNVVIVNSTTITCTTAAAVPAGATGPTRVSVVDPSNANATGFLEVAFEYTATAPTVTSISPSSGNYNVATAITITGTGFSPNFITNLSVPGQITCGGQTLTNLAFVSATQLTGTIQPMTATMNSRNQNVVVTNPDGNASAINAGDVFTYILRDPENDTGLQPAVIYRYYNNNTFNNNLPLNSFPLAVDSFNKIGTTNTLIFPNNANPFEPGNTNNIAVEFDGMLNIPTDGVWSFSTPSDDASLMYIGTTNIITNNGGHGIPGPSPNGSIGLKAGFHRFRVQYCQGGGGYGLNVLWSGPGVSQVDIPVGTADFTGAGFYCDAQPSILTVDVQSGPFAGGTTVNTISTGGGANYTMPATFPGTNPAGSSTLTSVSFQTIPLTRVASNPSAGQFAITGQTTLQINTPAGLFAGGAPIVLTTLNGLYAVLQPSAGVGFSYNADGTNYRTPENPATTSPGVNVKFLRTNGTSGTIPGIGADLVPSGGFLTGNGVTELDSYYPVKGLSLNPNAAPTADNFATNLMTGPLSGGAATGTLLSFAQDTANFYMKATGYIKITTPGLYTFTTNSDDNSRVFFGSTEVLTDIYPIGNAGFGVTSITNTINLGAGLHKYTVLYGQGVGGYGFSLQYSGPDNGNTLGFVPDSVLFTDSAPPSFASPNPITPTGGSALGNTAVTATGTGFVSGAQVFVNGLPANHVVVNSNGTIVTFNTPVSTVGQAANVVIVNPNGMSDTAVNAFTYDGTGRPPDLATGAPQAVQGCYFRYYEGNEGGLANGINYATIGTPFRVGAKTTAEYVPENTINYPTRASTGGNNFCFQYTGYLNIPVDDTYTFYTASDDSSLMFIGGVQVVNNDFAQGITTRSNANTIHLQPGLHEFTVQYAEGGGGYGCYVGWSNTTTMNPDPNAQGGANHGGPPVDVNGTSIRIPATAYYYVPPTWQSAGTSNWSAVSSWNAGLSTSTDAGLEAFNSGLGAFAPVQSTNDDDGQVDTVFRFNGNGLSPFTAVNDSINNTPLYYMELNSNVNGNIISGNTLKTLGASAGTAPAEQYNGFTKPGIVQNGSGSVNISAPVYNRDSLVLSGNGTGVVTLSGTQTNYANGTDVKSIYKSGSSQFAINGNASLYTGGGTNTGYGFVEVDGGTLGLNATIGASGANAVNANVGQNGTAGTLRGIGNISGNLIVGAAGTVFPGDLTVPNTVTLTDTTNTLTNGTLGNLTVQGVADLSAGGTLYVRVFSPHPGSISSDKLTVLSGTITLINASNLNIHVQAEGNYSTPNDTLIADMQVNGNLFNSTPFQSVSVSSKTAGGQAGNIGTNLQVLYVNSSIFTPNTAGTNGVVGVYTNGDASPPSLSGSFDRIYVRLTGNVTPVTVDSFAAKAEGAGVTVDWHVASEYMNLGFDVYRRPVGTKSWTQINSTLIPGHMTSPSSRTYRVADWPAPGVYEYRLGSVNCNNASTDYYSHLTAPVTVDGAGAAISAEGLDAALKATSNDAISAHGAELAASLNLGAQLQAGANDGVNAAELAAIVDNGANAESARSMARVNDPQLATINGSALNNAIVRDIVATVPPQNAGVASASAAAASGNRSYEPTARGVLPRYVSVPAGGTTSQSSAKIVYNGSGVLLVPNASLPAGYNAGNLRIQRQGVAQSALAVTPNGLLLYGPGYSDAYTDSDVFFASPSNSPTPAGLPALASGLFAGNNSPVTGVAASATQQFTDVYFDWGLRPYNYPPYFSSQYLTSGGTASFTMNVSNASSAASSLIVNAWSLTSSPSASPDHALQAFVNGVAVGQAVWTGGGRFVAIAFQVPAGVLVAGNNAVELVTPALPGVATQIALLHSLSVNYNMSLNGPGSMTLVNASTAAQLYEVANMATASLWVVDTRYTDRAALIPYETQLQADGTYKVRFNAQAGGTGQFLVVPQGSEMQPLAVTQRTIKPIPSGLQYIATGPSQFAASVQTLLATREKEGIKSAFVDQEQLFDYYNYGRYGPDGIHNAVLSVCPQYLMLVGRTCYDYHNYSGANIDPLCPSYLISTTFWSQTESDAAFGDLGSGYAEVRVGRLPANTPSEASTAVSHILNYSGLPSTGWRAFIAADTPDPLAGDFAAEADDVINSNPSITWTHSYLGVTDPTAATVTASMRQAACGGADLLMYNGHGSALYLGNTERILQVSDVQQWTGNSVFLAATCTFNWVAKVEEDYHSLPIQGLVQPQGGIAASIGTTTYMDSQPDIDFMKQLLAQGQSAAPSARWGDVLMRTQQWAYQKGQDNSQGSASWYLDLSRTECILGDPAMPLFGKSVPNGANGANGGTGGNTGTGGSTGTGSVNQGTF